MQLPRRGHHPSHETLRFVFFLIRSFHPQGVVDHHDDAGFHISAPEYPVQPYHGGLDQISFDLLSPRHPELSLHFC